MDGWPVWAKLGRHYLKNKLNAKGLGCGLSEALGSMPVPKKEKIKYLIFQQILFPLCWRLRIQGGKAQSGSFLQDSGQIHWAQ
jgi:hypothetical protein